MKCNILALVLSLFVTVSAYAKPLNDYDYPILMINLDPSHLPAVTGMVDVALYYTSYTASDTPATALNEARAKDLIDAAVLQGMSIGVYFPPYSSTSGQTIPATGTPIPTDNPEITADFITEWAAQVDTSIQSLMTYNDAAIAAWYGLEEIRYFTTDGDYAMQVALRDVIDSRDSSWPADRPLISYAPQNYMAGGGLLYNNFQYESGGGIAAMFNPVSPVSFTWDDGRAAYYPTNLEFKQVTAAPVRLQEHFMQGNYTRFVLGDYATTNSVLSYHRMNVLEEARTNLAGVNGGSVPDKIFHMPGMTNTGMEDATQAEARHDFWAGIHKADGVYIYNYVYKDKNPRVWYAYRQGLRRLNIFGMRDYIVAQTTPTTLTVTIDAPLQEIDGTLYAQNVSAQDHLVLPEYPSVQATLFDGNGSGTDGYLVVTHSYQQEATVTVSAPRNFASITPVVSGEGAQLVSGDLVDTFSGIDGRVYYVTF